MSNFETREQWLQAALEKMRPLFKSAGYTIPRKVRASCGYPARGGARVSNKRIGECHPADNSADHSFEIFIHPQQFEPILKDGSGVLETLAHEAGHATVGLEHGHKKPFSRFCKAIGLEGKPTATHAGEKLVKQLQEIADELGPYPHAALQISGGKQTTRLIAVRCTRCECVVRITRKWLDEAGAPTCGCGAPMEETAQADPNAIRLRTVEQIIMYTTPDERFAIKFVKDRTKGQLWYLVDYEFNGKLTLCDDRQDCLDTITAIREGVKVYDDVEVEDESDYEIDEFENNHFPFFEALTPEHHLPGWDHEDHDYPDDNGPATPFDYEAAKGIVVPEWDSTRDKYIENEQPEIVPATRPAPQPETVEMFGPEALRA